MLKKYCGFPAIQFTGKNKDRCIDFGDGFVESNDNGHLFVLSRDMKTAVGCHVGEWIVKGGDGALAVVSSPELDKDIQEYMDEEEMQKGILNTYESMISINKGMPGMSFEDAFNDRAIESIKKEYEYLKRIWGKE